MSLSLKPINLSIKILSQKIINFLNKNKEFYKNTLFLPNYYISYYQDFHIMYLFTNSYYNNEKALIELRRLCIYY